MSVVQVLSPDHPFRYPPGSNDLAASLRHYRNEPDRVSADSALFASAPSSPSRSHARDIFYSAPPSPSRSLETLESFYEVATLQDGTVASPEGNSFYVDPDCWFDPSGFQSLSVQSTQWNPDRAGSMGFEHAKDSKAQSRHSSGRYKGSDEAGKGLDSEFEFSSEFEDGSFVQMSSADELFFKGKILPLVQPQGFQKKSQEFALLDHRIHQASFSAPSSPSIERVTRGEGFVRPKSRLGLKSSFAEARNVQEEIPRQGWAKAFAKSRLFGKNQRTPPPLQPVEALPLSSRPQQRTKQRDLSKKLDLSVDRLRALRVDDAPSQIQSIKASGNHAGRKEVLQQPSHQRHVGTDLQDVPEIAAVKKWYDKDGDKRTKKGGARSWPRPSARSVLATRSSRDVDSSKQGSLAAPLEMHYRNSVATSEQMRKKTFLPYKQSLLGCLGFGSMWVSDLSAAFDSDRI